MHAQKHRPSFELMATCNAVHPMPGAVPGGCGVQLEGTADSVDSLSAWAGGCHNTEPYSPDARGVLCLPGAEC